AAFYEKFDGGRVAHHDARREVVARLGGHDARAARFGVAKQRGADALPPLIAIDGEDAQRLSARHRHSCKVSEDANDRIAAHSRLETLLLSDSGEVVWRI